MNLPTFYLASDSVAVYDVPKFDLDIESIFTIWPFGAPHFILPFIRPFVLVILTLWPSVVSGQWGQDFLLELNIMQKYTTS